MEARVQAKTVKPTTKKPEKDPRWPFAWEIIPENLAEAVRVLGLQHPVRVHRSPMRKWLGRYTRLNDAGEHVIKIASNLRSDWASKTLWHELKHAQQAERCGADQFDREYDMQLASAGLPQIATLRLRSDAEKATYLNIPFEREAKRAEGLDATLRLCRNARR
jgi:hypothetical protein